MGSLPWLHLLEQLVDGIPLQYNAQSELPTEMKLCNPLLYPINSYNPEEMVVQ